MSTYGILKRKTANRLGRTDNATTNTIRDNCIIDAATQIYNESKWSWTLKTDTLTVTAGVASLPTDYNPQFGLDYAVYEVTNTANDKPYLRVDPRDIDLYSTSDRVYYIDYDDTTDRYIFHSNQTTDTAKIYYHYLPAELSVDDDVCIIPDDMAVVYLAAAMWWLAKERDETNYDRFYIKYMARLDSMKSNDKSNNTYRRLMQSKLDDNSGTSILSTQR